MSMLTQVLFMALLFISSSVMADAVTVPITCQAPDTRTDGTPLSQSELTASCEIEIVINGEPLTTTYIAPWGTATDIGVQLDPAPLPYEVVIFAFATDTAGRRSEPSLPVVKNYLVESNAPPAQAMINVGIAACATCSITEVTPTQ